MADWWKRMLRAEHSTEATDELSEKTVVRVQDVRNKRQALEKLLAEVQEKRQADEH